MAQDGTSLWRFTETERPSGLTVAAANAPVASRLQSGALGGASLSTVVSRFHRAVTNDTKIQDIALAYMRKAAGERTEWPCTTLGALHSSLIGRLPLDDGELVLVSAFFSSESWYAFTTRRMVSQFRGVRQSLDPSHGIHDDFGNFKGYGPSRGKDTLPEAGVVPREVATITATDSRTVVRFEFETWEASMLPIYAARYWVVKHPAIDKLMTVAERESYRIQKG